MRRRTQEVTDIYDERDTSPSTQSSTLIKYFALLSSHLKWFSPQLKKKFQNFAKRLKAKRKKKMNNFFLTL